jgi:hypothetical protein
VGTDEGPEAEVNDAGAKPAAIIGWALRSGFGKRESCRREKRAVCHHRFLLIRHH